MHLNKLIRRAHLERDIDALARVNIYANIVGSEFRESFVLNADRVKADFDIEEIVATAIVGCDLVFDPRLTTGERHGGFRNCGARCVFYSAENLGGFELAE